MEAASDPVPLRRGRHKTFKRFKWLISPLRLDMLEQAQLLETLAGNARRSGMLALEGMIP